MTFLRLYSRITVEIPDGGGILKSRGSKWFIALAGIIAIVIIASLGTIYAQQLEDESQLKQDITLAKQRLGKVQVDELAQKKESLEKQLAQTKADFESIKAELSRPFETVGTVYTLFDIAASAGVEIVEINSSVSAFPGEDLGGLKCFVEPVTMRIQGDLGNLVDCILKLNWGLTNGVVKSAEIDETAPGTTPSAIIKLLIYSYQGK